MNKRVYTILFYCLTFPIFFWANKSTTKVDEEACLTFVFIPSNYNGSFVSCSYATDGQLTINTFGGNTPYSYLWSDGYTGFQKSNLGGGTYAVTVTDANGCSLASSITMEVPNLLSATTSPIANSVSCPTSNDGVATVIPTGGTAPYFYTWDSNNTSPTANDLDCGLHTVTVTDANGCSTVASTYLNCPPPLNINLFSISNYNGFNVSCPEATDGVANATVLNGNPPYSYEWSSSDTGPSSNNLIAGINSLTVTDASGCSITSFIEMTAPPTMVITPTVLSDYDGAEVSCHDATDGQVSLQITNGTAPYQYIWENGENDSQANQLSAGNNSVTIVDADGCVVDEVIELEAYELSIQSEVASNYNGVAISCFGASDGAIQILVAAGSSSPANVDYAWSDGSQEDVLENMPAGTYTVTVTSPYGCAVTSEATLTAPSMIQGETEATSDFNGYPISINGLSDGSAVASANGGTPPFGYLWENGATEAEVQGLAAGSSTVTITDANGCEITSSVLISQPDVLEGYADVSSDYSGQDISCHGESDGKAVAFGEGGVPPYQFEWSNNTAKDSTNQLAPGEHQVTITDLNGASMVTEITISEPQPLELEISSTSASNPPDGTVTVTPRGGTLPYQFNWDDSNNSTSATVENLLPDWYRVTVKDANGCTEDAIVEVEESLEINCIKKDIVFTPNGDGRNDFLNLPCIHNFNNEVLIFDRWGNTVFQTANYDGTWDSKMGNQDVPDGGYFYVIEVALPNGKRTMKGSITIIR